MFKRLVLDPILRVGFRLANFVIGVDRRVRSSRGRGVKFIVDGGERGMLLVRHTYGERHWTFPGGRVGRSETAEAAARREIFEELSIEATDLIDVGSYPARTHRRNEVVSVFVVRLQGHDPRPNPVELAATGWFKSTDLPTAVDPSVMTALGLFAGTRAETAARRALRSP